MLQAERAAKYAADEEAKELQRMLEEVIGARGWAGGSAGLALLGLHASGHRGWLSHSWHCVWEEHLILLWGNLVRLAHYLFPPCLPRPARQVNATLANERQFAQRLGEDAARTKKQLHDAMHASAVLSSQNSALDEGLQQER